MWNEELNTHVGGQGFTATPKDPDCIAIGSRKKLTALAKSRRKIHLGEVR